MPGDGAADLESTGNPSGVTIDAEAGNSLANDKHPDNKSTNTTNMAPKPALYESSKGEDCEHNLLAASQEVAHYSKEYPADYDDASYSEHSFVSHSDAGNTDGEFDDDDTEARRDRRSRRLPKQKTNSRSQEQESRPEKHCNNPEAVDEGPPRRRSTASMGMSIGKATDQSYVKLLHFQTLHRAEKDRCPEYMEKLEEVVAQWNDCKTTLHRLLDEVEHANHLFNVSEASFFQYSHVMYSIHKDIFLDDQGQRVTSSARQQLLLKQRGSGHVDASVRKNQASLACTSGYLDPLYNSFSVLSDTMMKAVLERESDTSKHAATLDFKEFSEELVSQAEAMRALGDSVVKEMEGSEVDIQNAFRVLEQLAAKVKSSKASSANVLDDDIKLKKTDKNFPTEMEYGGNNASVGDWWLWETLYRAAVKHQQITWSANYDRVQGLAESLQYFQDKHEKKLEKAVLAVMPEQREMFLVGAKAFEAALQKTDAFAGKLEGNAGLNHENIADEFEKGVQKHSNKLIQNKTQHKSAILNRSRSKYNSAIQQAESMPASSSGEVNGKALQAFGSPMHSKLVLKAQVLERWEKPAGWMTTIAVFTADRFLHLFDCSDLSTKTLPQTAFSSMFPTTASARAGVHHQGKGRKGVSRATENKVPTPSMSFNLVTCALKTYGYSRRSFEIKQVADPATKSSDLPHTTLRFKDNPDAVEWFGLLQDLPELVPHQSNNVYHQEVMDQKLVEDEAAKASTLYDEAEELAGSDHNEEDEHEHEHDLDDDSESEESKNEDGANFTVDADMFEDASEYMEDASPTLKDEEEVEDGRKYKVGVKKRVENDDDSFHST